MKGNIDKGQSSNLSSLSEFAHRLRDPLFIVKGVRIYIWLVLILSNGYNANHFCYIFIML